MRDVPSVNLSCKPILYCLSQTGTRVTQRYGELYGQRQLVWICEGSRSTKNQGGGWREEKEKKKSRTCSAFPLPLLWLCTSNARPRISKLSRNLEAKLGEWNPRQPELILGTKSEHAAQRCGTIGFNVWKLLQNLQDGQRAGTGFFLGFPHHWTAVRKFTPETYK